MTDDIIKTLITVQFSDPLLTRIRNVSPRLKVTAVKANKAENIPESTWKEIEVLYTSKILPTPEMAPKLRWIQFHSAGVDHAIDSPVFKKPNLVATTLSGASASQVSEYVLMMLLAFGHRLPEMIALQRKGEWPRDRWERFTPRELRGSTVGIVGYGSIGRQIARLLVAFGAQVVATKRDVMHPEDRGYIPEGLGDPETNFVRRLYPPEALRSMFKECDFVVITVPLTPQTKRSVNADVLAALKPTAFLVDVSRGGVVDHAALISALQSKEIAGAALDVFPHEPLPPESVLWKMPNVIITPHVSGNTTHYDERAVDVFIENLHRYLAGLPLYNRVDLERGY